jgi:hypothetical protein
MVFVSFECVLRSGEIVSMTPMVTRSTIRPQGRLHYLEQRRYEANDDNFSEWEYGRTGPDDDSGARAG